MRSEVQHGTVRALSSYSGRTLASCLLGEERVGSFTRHSEMAEASISWAEDQFCCPVCLDLLKDPAAIPCGHSYCMRCISDVWDQDDQKATYGCPLCKQTFSPRPALSKNVVIAEMVEKLRATRPRAAAPAASGDVRCDSCAEIKRTAVRSCLECRSSYCQEHLEQHENLFRSKKHSLMDANGRLQEMVCSEHDKILDVYCRTDRRCICTMCLVDEHKNHDAVSAVEERKEKQGYLEDAQRNVQKTIQRKERDLLELREAVESHKRSAHEAVQETERIFTQLVLSIEKCRSDVKRLITDQERVAVSRVEEQLERVKLELSDLRGRDAELKRLSETQDHVHFLKSLPSVSFSESTDGFTLTNHSFDDVVKSVSQLGDRLQQFSIDEAENISKRVKTIQVFQTTECQLPQDSHPVELTAKAEDPQPLPFGSATSLFKAEDPKPLPFGSATSLFKADDPKPLPFASAFSSKSPFKAGEPKPPGQ